MRDVLDTNRARTVVRVTVSRMDLVQNVSTVLLATVSLIITIVILVSEQWSERLNCGPWHQPRRQSLSRH